MSMRELEKYLAQLMMHRRLGNEDDDHRFSLNTTIALRTTSFWLFMVGLSLRGVLQNFIGWDFWLGGIFWDVSIARALFPTQY